MFALFSRKVLKLFIITIMINTSIINSQVITLDLSTAEIVNRIDSKFLSFTVDAHQLAKGWSGLNLTSRRLRRLTSNLKPAYLRIGGTDADSIVFSQPENGKDFLLLADFVKETKVDLIYGLNVLQREKTNLAGEKSCWNATNTKSLMNFLSKHKVKVFGWELGNEPDSFLHVFNVSLKSSTLARDFSSLKKIIADFPLYKNSLIIGPDVTRPTGKNSRSLRYLKGFLRHIDIQVLDIVTFHQYYFDGRLATVNDFLNVTVMDALRAEISRVRRSVQKYVKGTLIWIGETSSGWGGGCQNISDRFVSSFLYLDKLGQAARFGVNAVFRQTLIGGNYGLINLEEEPTPDYFVSLLHKRLVGPQTLGWHDYDSSPSPGSPLLNLKMNGNFVASSSTPKGLRLYVHCTLSRHKFNGSITIFGINVENQDVRVWIKGGGSEDKQNLIEEYVLQAPNLTSKYSYLNGRVLKLSSDDSLPPLNPITIVHNSFLFPKQSMGFWVLPLANHPLCI